MTLPLYRHTRPFLSAQLGPINTFMCARPGLWTSWTQYGSTNPNFFFALTLTLVAAQVSPPPQFHFTDLRYLLLTASLLWPFEPQSKATLTGDLCWAERLRVAKAEQGPGKYELVTR
jgi:hypothetical protein